jgi:hypothetical protein
MQPIVGQGEKETYDEPGYIAIPPCLWGDAADGLQEPVLLPLDTTLLSIKQCNSTMHHTGDMAMWQMRGIVVPKEEEHETTPKTLRASVTKDKMIRRVEDQIFN